MIEADRSLHRTPTGHKSNIAHVLAEGTSDTSIEAWGSENSL